MLNEIFNQALSIMQDRDSSTIYCGWGTTLDQMVQEYLDLGGSWRLTRKVLNLAYYRR